jgi:hypothetical protein
VSDPLDFLARLERELAAAERNLAVASRPRARSAALSLWARHRRLGRPLLVTLALLLGVTGAAFAGRVLVGSPAPRPYQWGPRAPYGRILPHRTRILSLRAPDPAGGPPWGMRVIYAAGTSRRSQKSSTPQVRACVQIGRILDGKLGVLGQDGAFHDDRLFHELPVEPQGCGGVSKGRPVSMGGGADIEAASAYQGLDGCTIEREDPALQSRYIHRELAIARYEGDTEGVRGALHELATTRRLSPLLERQPVCPAADLRSIVFGFAGPHANHMTVTVAGQRVMVDVSPREDRAYLVVRRRPLTTAPPRELRAGGNPAAGGSPQRPSSPAARSSRGAHPLTPIAVRPGEGSSTAGFTLTFRAVARGGGYTYFVKAPRPGRCQRLADDSTEGSGVQIGSVPIERGEVVSKKLHPAAGGLCAGSYRVYVAFFDPLSNAGPNWPFGIARFTVAR